MVRGAEALIQRGNETEGGTGTRAGAPAADPEGGSFLRNRLREVPAEAEDRLIRQLAADHLRELRDDGLTLGYIARMYGISPERMEQLYNHLVPSPPR
jgi:hypothetical protein